MALFRTPKYKSDNSNLSTDEVREYLDNNPSVLEDFLVSSSSKEFLENVIAEKKKRIEQESTKSHIRARSSKHVSSFYTDVGMEAMCRRIIACTKDEEIYTKIYEICKIITHTLQADDFSFFVLTNGEDELALYNPYKGKTKVGSVATNRTLAAEVVKTKKVLNIENVHTDKRFPKGTGDERYNKCHALGVPIILDCGTVYCVIEFLRLDLEHPFDKYDFELTSGILSWIMACVQKMKMNRMLKIQEALNNFLLESTKVMFDDMENTDALITNIMAFTKDLVTADRCSLFLVDEERNELFADYFDDGEKNEEGVSVFTKKSQIRFSRDKGIAGYVSKTGEIVNIQDAYSDDRFNTEVDKKTGYQTRNILCMPILGKTGVIGVVQLINRINANHFSMEDESAFKLFAVYCALALHYSRLYNMLVHSQVKYKVAMDILHYHISCSDEEFNALVQNPVLPASKIPASFHDFTFCCYDYEKILPQLFVTMVLETFGEHEFEMQKLCRFVLTVRKNYRPIQYHNWMHGFHVAHAVWRIMESADVECTKLEKMALLVGGVCHDIDHRGYNNEFFKKLQHPLAALYSTSVMEQHHYKQTITILHAEGHDIFSGLSVKEHKQVVELIRRYIIATDLATYFPNQKFLTGVIERDEFDVTIQEHHDALFSLMMTAADLCAICKPWETQKKTAQLIYDEFYMQGDEEKKRGLQPIPMMDRINKDDIPKMQVGFIGFICKPMYTTLASLLPKTQPFLDGCLVCMNNWKTIMEEQQAAASAAADK